MKPAHLITRILFISFILFGTATQAVAQLSENDVALYVEKVQRQFEVPGIGLAIVKDGKVLLAEGFGVRKLGAAAKVDAHTLFGIASNTKAFTATALGILVEEHKIEWDAPVIRYLPWFRLSDPYVTKELTIRDLLVHRSGLGLGAGDLLWWPSSTYNRRQIAERLQFIPLATSFRAAYAYDNVLYLVAGEVIETVTGMSWEEFMATRILAPVGMTDSKVKHSDAAGDGNIASTHARVDGIVRPIEPFTSDNTNPAGGINASAADMAKWMIVQLDSGRLAEGKRLFSPRTTVQLWNMVTPIPVGNPPPELSALRANFNGYALGFGVRDYRGYKLVQHTGGLPGYVSKVAMIPELKIGVAVLTNQESGDAFESITYEMLDRLIAGHRMDWLKAYTALRNRLASSSAAMEERPDEVRDKSAHPALPLAAYAGTYTDPWYGTVSIHEADGRLLIRFDQTPSLAGRLEFWQYDTFVARWDDPELRADAFVTFSLKPDGTIDHATMRAVSKETDFSFDFQDLFLKPLPRGNR